MPEFGKTFEYETFNGVLRDVWAVYRGIIFEDEKYDEAHVHLKTGEIELYDDTDPNAKVRNCWGRDLNPREVTLTRS